MGEFKPKVQAIKFSERKLEKIEARREELFKYFRDKCDRFKTVGTIKEGRPCLEERNLEDYKKSLSYRDVEAILPKKLIKIKHKGPLRILAFSDWRVHDIDMLLDFVKGLKEKPDLIVYAGDDVRRFVPIPSEELLELCVPSGDNLELEEVILSEAYNSMTGHHSIIEVCGYLLRIPKYMDREGYVQARVSAMLGVVRRLHEALKRERFTAVALRELLAKEYPSLKLVESGDKVAIVDESTGTKVLEMVRFGLERLVPRGGYWNLFLKVGRSTELPNITYKRVREDGEYVYYYIGVGQPRINFFEELAREAKYGLAAVIGNDDLGKVRFWIRGERVYELHTTWLKIGAFLFVGLEGSTCGMGPSGEYLEGDVMLRLEIAESMLGPRDKLVIVSHTPPRGVLDRAMRYGDRAIGSLALREFLEEHRDVALVICGHVHRCGGMYEKLDGVAVVNVSSHDYPFERANIAWITIEEAKGVEVKMMKLPSPIEHIFKSKGEDRWPELLQLKANLSPAEAALFIEAFKRYGERFFDDLSELASLKFQYGFSWDNVFKLYARGVRAPEQIMESIYREVLEESLGIYKEHLKKAYVKLKRMSEGGRVYLLNPLPFSPNDKLVVFDTEYSDVGVLYGFLDLSSGELKQFWFNEKGRAAEYLDAKRDCLFVHWGGSDKRLIEEELGRHVRTLDLLYYIQTSLVAPISSAALCEVHDALCGHRRDEWWERSFYGMDGLYKLALCNRILRNPDDLLARKELSDANKADLLALAAIMEGLRKIRTYPHLNLAKFNDYLATFRTWMKA